MVEGAVSTKQGAAISLVIKKSAEKEKMIMRSDVAAPATVLRANERCWFHRRR